MIYGCIFAACHIFCFAKTKEVVEVPEKEKMSLKLQLSAVSKNRPYLIAVAGQFLFGVALCFMEEMRMRFIILHMWREIRHY